ncbi:MAG: GNAT family N-acetyltransferase [Alphaproteobacteria bacterium]|nr:GNAT family N-acetyltransferase [Alphaproteobacteria bacterium]
MPSKAILTTPRLALTTFSGDDLADLYALHCDPQVNRFLGSHEIIHTREDARRHLSDYVTGQERRGFSQWKASLDDGTFAGRAGFSVYRDLGSGAQHLPEVEFWGKGYASELADALVEWFFDTTYFTHLIAFVAAGNEPARRMMEANGFRQRQRMLIDDAAFDCLQILSPALAKRFASNAG